MKPRLSTMALTVLALAAGAATVHAATPQAASSSTRAASQTSAARALAQLADDYYLAQARFDPVMASENGDGRFFGELGLPISPENRTRQLALYRDYLARLAAIDRKQLNEHEQASVDVLQFELETALRMGQFPEHLLPMDQMFSMPVLLANYAAGQGTQPLATPADYRAYLARLAQLVPYIDQAIANMREGVKQGIVHAKEPAQAMLAQLRQLQAASAEASVFYTPIKNFPAAFSASERERLGAEYRRVVGSELNPALGRLVTFLDKEYLPRTRTSAGWNALPNGDAWYRARVAASTTTGLTPDEIHALGLKEVARIQHEYGRIGPQMGYSGPAAGLPRWVAAQAKYKPFKSDQEIIAVFKQLDATVRTKLPALFSLRPKAPLDVRLEPELSRESASDHYTPPASDGSRPGVFWSVVNDPKQYGKTGMVTLYLHEGQPGHHFHIALLQELGLPDFRKYGGNTAFTEGWALYAETLGKEMGLFDKPEDYFGHLNDEMLRAARLVVDTGMHAKGWSRAQAIEYLRDTLGYSELEARAQIDRYIVMPAQALAYKIGALRIAQLRRQAEQALGSKFSLPAFHAVVLGEGTLPLDVLQARVERWIAQNK